MVSEVYLISYCLIVGRWGIHVVSYSEMFWALYCYCKIILFSFYSQQCLKDLWYILGTGVEEVSCQLIGHGIFLFLWCYIDGDHIFLHDQRIHRLEFNAIRVFCCPLCCKFDHSFHTAPFLSIYFRTLLPV